MAIVCATLAVSQLASVALAESQLSSVALAISVCASGTDSETGSEFASPTDLATAVTGSSGNWTITLTFTAPSLDVTGYTLEISENGGAYSSITPDSITGTTTITYTFNGISDGLYLYRITANYAGGDSDAVVFPGAEAFINLNYDASGIFHTIAIAE
jgi:hypothetical protein